ncbi:hypothetical protein CEXT_228921 [Caerostris extrusa]|uniref:Uncharacterized protein n=1 Tax=Caerostris extrusa TaxID=172846 RepID=A0AAV4NS75_CAEEX|nr:hypothetical protein CEXT_228921 [Caerostris extrusa]
MEKRDGLCKIGMAERTSDLSDSNGVNDADGLQGAKVCSGLTCEWRYETCSKVGRCECANLGLLSSISFRLTHPSLLYFRNGSPTTNVCVFSFNASEQGADISSRP